MKNTKFEKSGYVDLLEWGWLENAEIKEDDGYYLCGIWYITQLDFENSKDMQEILEKVANGEISPAEAKEKLLELTVDDIEKEIIENAKITEDGRLKTYACFELDPKTGGIVQLAYTKSII